MTSVLLFVDTFCYSERLLIYITQVFLAIVFFCGAAPVPLFFCLSLSFFVCIFVCLKPLTPYETLFAVFFGLGAFVAGRVPGPVPGQTS